MEQRMIFRNRLDAARQLLALLGKYHGRGAVVLGIPRGGVPMAAWIADRLDADLDVLLVHKISAPGSPEVAIGAVDESGVVWLSSNAAYSGATEQYTTSEAKRELQRLRERRQRYSQGRPPIPVKGRTVIVVDDGVATGSTLLAGLRSIHRLEPTTVVAAVGVAPTETLWRLHTEADEVVCAYDTDEFTAVGEFYAEFNPVSDEEVVRLLSGHAVSS